MATDRVVRYRLEATNNDVKNKIQEASKETDKLKNKLDNIGNNLKQAGGALTKGITLPLIAIGGLLAKTAIDAGKYGDEILTLSAKTGIATDTLQELSYASEFVDVDLETMTGSIYKLTRAMSSAERGSKTQKEAFKILGIEITDNNGKLRDARTVWYEAIDALGEIEDQTTRDALAMAIFGKSAQELNPLIVAGSEQLKKLADEAQRLGLIFSKDDIEAMGKFDDERIKLMKQLDMLKKKLGVEVIPVIQQMMPAIQNTVIPALTKFVKWIGELLDKFNKLSPENKKMIGAFVAIAVAIGPILSLIGSLGMAISMLMSPIGIIIAIILVVAGLAAIIIRYWDPIKKFFVDLWRKITAPIKEAIDQIKNFIEKVKEAIKKFKEFLGITDDKGVNYSDSFFPELKGSGGGGTGAGSGGGFGGRPNKLGTDYAQKGFSLVGEEGPEIVQFSGGEKVIDAIKTKTFMNNAGYKNSTSNYDANGRYIVINMNRANVQLTDLNGRYIANLIMPEITNKIKLAGGR